MNATSSHPPVYVIHSTPVHISQSPPVYVIQLPPVYVIQSPPVYVIQSPPVYVIQYPQFTSFSHSQFTSSSHPPVCVSDHHSICLKTKPYLRADNFLIKEKLFWIDRVTHAFNHINVENGRQRQVDFGVFEVRLFYIANLRLAGAYLARVCFKKRKSFLKFQQSVLDTSYQ